MLHGDVLTISPRGLLVDEKSLEPLGIFDRSICWGVWIEDPHMKVKPGGYRHRNLVFSAFHPRTWPFLLRIRILLVHRPDTLPKIFKFLRRSGLSILLARYVLNGFTHSTLEVIVQSVRVKELPGGKSSHGKDKSLVDDKFNLDHQYPLARIDGPAYQAASKLGVSICSMMMLETQRIRTLLSRHLRRLKADLDETAIEENEFPWLYSPGESDEKSFPQDQVVETMNRTIQDHNFAQATQEIGGNDDDASEEFRIEDSLYFDPPEQSPGDLKANSEKLFDGENMSSHSVHYLKRLAYFSIFGAGGQDLIFPAKFSSRDGLLRFDAERILDRHQLCPVPVQTLAAYDIRNKFLRLEPVARHLHTRDRKSPKVEQKSLYLISVEYEIFKRDPKRHETSRGALELLTSQLEAAGAEIVECSNRWTQDQYGVEAGQITFTVVAPRSKREEAERRLIDINHHRPEYLDHFKVKDVSVREHEHRGLFISMRFGHPRQGDLRSTIETVCGDFAFSPYFVETNTRSVTGSVTQQIVESSALLQILWLRADDEHSKTPFHWLDFEYGYACARGLPRLRMVDVSQEPIEWWQREMVTDRDYALSEFRSDASQEDLETSVRNAIRQLSKEAVAKGL